MYNTLISLCSLLNQKTRKPLIFCRNLSSTCTLWCLVLSLNRCPVGQSVRGIFSSPTSMGLAEGLQVYASTSETLAETVSINHWPKRLCFTFSERELNSHFITICIYSAPTATTNTGYTLIAVHHSSKNLGTKYGTWAPPDFTVCQPHPS